MNNAKLKFTYSTMGGGKSTALLLNEYKYKESGFNTLIIKPQYDDREGKVNGFGQINSRIIKGKHPALYVQNINADYLYNTYKFDIMFVDEVQFFNREDILQLSILVDKYNVPVFCYGLKTDCAEKLFEGSNTLLAIADETEEMYNLCKCGEKATHHVRYVDEKIDLIGEGTAIEKDNITYESVCRKCWKKLMER